MMLPSRSFRSSRSLARQKIAITSDATVMSKPSSRGNPLATPPSEETTERSARSFMSSTRRHITRRGEQIVGGCDGVEVAGEVQIDLLQRHDRRIAAPRRTALHTE